MTDYSTGECPPDEPIGLVPEDMYMQRAAERGRHEVVLGAIRGHLEEQPTATAVQAAVRHWISDLIALGEDVARAKRKTT